MGLVSIGILVGMVNMIVAEYRWKEETQIFTSAKKLQITGQIAKKEYVNDRLRFELAVSGYQNHILVYLEDAQSSDCSFDTSAYIQDAVITVTGTVSEFDAPTNQGQFNEREYYKSKGMLAKLYASQACVVRVPKIPWREAAFLLRQRLTEIFSTHLPQEEAGILATMLAGDRALLDPDVKKLFQNAGISHILTISGMHISMIGMALWMLSRKICLRRGWSVAWIVACLMFYGTMTGMGISTMRAVGMFALYLLAQLVGRNYDSLSAWAVWGSILLLQNPFLICNVSFQFSFLAVFAVIISSDVIKTEKQITIKSGLSKLMIPFLLQVFTYPLVACYYYELPVYAIFINLLLLPYLGVVMGLGFLGAVLFLCCPFSVSVVWLPVHWILYVYVRVCEFVSALPAHTWIVGKPSGMKVFVYYLLLAGLIALLYAKKEKLYQQFLWQIGGSIALVLLLSISGQRGFEVDFLDVGQGDASYIRSSDGCSMFVDGGSTSTKEVGTYRILPFLKSKGIRDIDYWVLSHLDEDHVSGFYEVLESGYPIRCLLLAKDIAADDEKSRLLTAVGKYDLDIVWLERGDVVKLGEKSRLRILSPGGGIPIGDRNDASLVFLLEDDDFSGLWTGDITAKQEEAMMNQGDRIGQVTLYKAAHHGSKYSNSKEYLQKLSPQISIISCNRYNRYGHPGEEAIAHMEASGSKLYYTMYGGQISVYREKEKLHVREFSD